MTKTNIFVFKQYDEFGLELAGYWEDKLDYGCITAVVLSEYNSFKHARAELESFIMDCLDKEELKKVGKIIYKGERS